MIPFQNTQVNEHPSSCCSGKKAKYRNKLGVEADLRLQLQPIMPDFKLMRSSNFPILHIETLNYSNLHYFAD